MSLLMRRDLQQKIGDLRRLEKVLSRLTTISPSILDSIHYRISISTIAWPHGIVKGLPERTMDQLPEDLRKTLDAYYALSKEFDFFLKSIREGGDMSIMACLGLRKKMISVVRFIRKGLLKEAISTMGEVLSIFKDYLEVQGHYPTGLFSTFWRKYSKSEEYYREMFLPSFPTEYDPLHEADYNFALEKSMNLEETCLNSALAGNFEIANNDADSWFGFMTEFVSKNQYRKTRPKRII